MADYDREILRLYEKGSMTYEDIAKKMGLTFKQVSHSLTRARKTFRRGKVSQEPAKQETQEYNNGLYTFDKLIEICEGEELTPERTLKAHNLDPAAWEVVSYRNNYWHSQVRGGKRMVMYQSRLSARPIKKAINLDELEEHFKIFIPKIYEPKTYPENGKSFMAEANIADLHLGKLCWHGDTEKNYDYKIARSNFQKIISDILINLKNKPLDYILFVWCNDFFNSDTISKTTTGETPQDTDVRWQKLFNIGVEMLVEAIESLMQIAPVKTFYTPSNHDQMVGYYALKYLSAWYRNCKDVEVDTSAFPRKYILYGPTLLGFTHGEKEKGKGTYEKASRLASVMPIEAAHLWGKAKYREMHAAHLHSEQMIEEINGVIVRRIASPTYADTYHTEHGFIGATQKAQTFIYDKEKGLRQIINTPV